MRDCYVRRFKTGDTGTFSQLISDKLFKCYAGELRWMDNKKGVSCIPPGQYLCKWMFSPKHNRNIYHVTGVPDRDDIEIHAANFCGDVSKGLKSEIKGCMILGNWIGVIDGQEAVGESSLALSAFEKHMNQEDFTLHIAWGKDVSTETPQTKAEA